MILYGPPVSNSRERLRHLSIEEAHNAGIKAKAISSEIKRIEGEMQDTLLLNVPYNARNRLFSLGLAFLLLAVVDIIVLASQGMTRLSYGLTGIVALGFLSGPLIMGDLMLWRNSKRISSLKQEHDILERKRAESRSMSKYLKQVDNGSRKTLKALESELNSEEGIIMVAPHLGDSTPELLVIGPKMMVAITIDTSPNQGMLYYDATQGVVACGSTLLSGSPIHEAIKSAKSVIRASGGERAVALLVVIGGQSIHKMIASGVEVWIVGPKYLGAALRGIKSNKRNWIVQSSNDICDHLARLA